MVHFEGCFNLFPHKWRGNKCTTTVKQHVNMFITRNSCEVAILVCCERGGLENSEVAHIAHRIAGETLNI